MKNKNLAPRKQRAVYLKRRILRRRADKDNAPPLDKGQECILLRFVKTVYLIHKDDGARSVGAIFFGFLHYGANLLYAARNRRKIYERRLRVFGDKLRQSRLAYARRPPKNHGSYGIVFD